MLESQFGVSDYIDNGLHLLVRPYPCL